MYCEREVLQEAAKRMTKTITIFSIFYVSSTRKYKIRHLIKSDIPLLTDVYYYYHYYYYAVKEIDKTQKNDRRRKIG